MNREIRTLKELTQQSWVKLYLPTRLPWLTIKWIFTFYANNFKNLKAFVGQALQECRYCQAEILISIICKTYSINIHKEFMNRNPEEITYLLSIVTISSVCIEAWRGIVDIFIIKMSSYFFCRFLECICCVTAQRVHILCAQGTQCLLQFLILPLCGVRSKNNWNSWLSSHRGIAQLSLVPWRRIRDWSTRFVKQRFVGTLFLPGHKCWQFYNGKKRRWAQFPLQWSLWQVCS